MANFQESYKQGKAGFNRGLPTGLSRLDKTMRGIQKKKIYGVAGGPKSGKTTFADFAFLLSPYEYMYLNGKLDEIEWIYFSFEIDRISKEFKFASYYFFKDYNIVNFVHKGKTYQISADYLMGMLIDDDDLSIPVSGEHELYLIEIYKRRIIPLFGEWDAEGKQVSRGKITFITYKENPTGLRKQIFALAERNGEFIKEAYNVKEGTTIVTHHKTVGYKPHNPKKFHIIITDHLRKIPTERNFDMKKNVDKYLEYQVEMRDLFHFTFVDIIHTNRNVGAVDRMKHAGEFLYPTGDDLKDTGNLSEDCDLLFTIFNANDEKYNLVKHFGYELKDYPLYRSIHIVEARGVPCPVHFQTNMYGGFNYFEQI